MAFSPKTIRFLKELNKNNNREWFNDNKQRYEDDVRTPALEFIETMAPKLEKLSGCVLAEAKKVGGSLMRPYRDTRFAKNAPPIKTNVGIQFRHRMGKDVHAPGWYVHIEPGQCFLGAGVWRPEPSALKKIRAAIDQSGKSWMAATKKATSKDWEQAGESLKRPPRDYSADHPNVDLLKLKDHILVANFKDATISDSKFADHVAKELKATLPYMTQLCEALGVPF